MRKLGIALVAAVAIASAGTAVVAQNWNAEPLYGTITLTTGFMPDPYVHGTPVIAGGADAVANLGIMDPTGGACRGYINAAAPDMRLHYTAGTTFPLRVYVVPQNPGADLTLLVNLPDTTWRCNDDFSGLSPLVHIDNPPSGQYDIWVGTYSATGVVPSTFFVSELTSSQP